jgi:hypothetical protein
MARYSVAAVQVGAKTSLRGPTLLVGTKDLALREVGVESTTAVSSAVALRIATTVGAAGTALDEIPWQIDRVAPTASATQIPSGDHTLIAGSIRIANLPAAIGGGIIWTFGPQELSLAGGSADAFTITLPSGSDAIVNFYFDWEE